jgi:hypothetical protein
MDEDARLDDISGFACLEAGAVDDRPLFLNFM